MKKELEIIVGAQELVAKLATPLSELDANIQDLHEKIAVLEAEIAAVDNQFSVESVTETMSKRQEIAIIEGIIKKAEQERARIVVSNYDIAFEGAQAAIRDHRKKAMDAYQEENVAIAQKAAAIRAIYAEMKQAQIDERNQVYAFLDELSPYLKPNQIGEVSGAYANLTATIAGGVFDFAPDVSDLKPKR